MNTIHLLSKYRKKKPVNMYTLENAFETTWNIAGANETLILPLQSNIPLANNAFVDWGDGTRHKLQYISDGENEHTYANSGTYTVKITGNHSDSWCFVDDHDSADKLLTAHYASGAVFSSLDRFFNKCSNLTSITGTIGDDGITTAYEFAHYCTDLVTVSGTLFDNLADVTTYERCFYATFSLLSIPSGLFDNSPLVTTFAYCFCASPIQAIPVDFFRYNTLVENFSSTFFNSSAIALIKLSPIIWPFVTLIFFRLST